VSVSDFCFPLGLGLGRDEYIEVQNYVVCTCILYI
jgi:hypothetical protein